MKMAEGLLCAALLAGDAALCQVPDAPQAAAHSYESATTRYLDSSAAADWPGYGRTFGEQHFGALTQINDQSISRLGLKWFMDLGPGNPVTQPVEVGGTLFFSSGLSIVHALDARSGKLLWRYDSRVAEHAGAEMRHSWGIRGLAWWDDKVYTGTVDGRLIALDARTGRELWTVQTTKPGSGQYITGAPRAFAGKVIIGQSGSDFTPHRGYATAYDARTGRQLWRFYVVPGNPAEGFENEAMQMAARTWKGDWWKWGGGGEPWNAFSYDAQTDTVFIGTGNGFPWNRRLRSEDHGDNLFVSCLIAVAGATGKYKWHYQFNPGDTWDYDAAADIELADLSIDGRLRKLAIIAPKNGFFYVIDRITGKLISAEKYARVTWAEKIDPTSGRPVEVADERYPQGRDFELWPSARGAHSWMPMAYSPQTMLAYIPKLEHGLTYNDRGITAEHWQPFGVTLGAARPDPLDNTSALLAWNPVTQKAAWQVDTFGGWGGGVLATAGNLVFQGQLNGRLSAYAADSGKELWSFAAQAPVLAAPITYSVDGVQYVTAMAGMGVSPSTEPASLGGLVIDGRTQKRRVLTFALDASAHLPAAPEPAIIKAPPDPGYAPDGTQQQRGLALYAEHCMVCHGIGAIAGGGAPDLRASPLLLSLPALTSTLHDGALVSRGMPKFAELNGDEIAALRQYLRARAADLRSGGS